MGTPRFPRNGFRSSLPAALALVAFSLGLIGAPVARPARAEAPAVHWRQVLKRFGILSKTRSAKVYLEEIPLEDWLDPELHRTLHEHQRKQFRTDALDANPLSERLAWAFAQKPELTAIWLPGIEPEADRAMLHWFFKAGANPFDAAPEPHFRKALRAAHSDAEWVEQLILRLEKFPKASGTAFDAPQGEPLWAEMERIFSSHPDLEAKFVAAWLDGGKPIHPTPDFLRGGLEKAPRLASRLLKTRPLEMFRLYRGTLATLKPLRDDPQLRARYFELAREQDNLCLDDLWLRYPDTRARLTEHVLKQGLLAGLSTQNGILPTFKASPGFGAWLQSLPEPWMRAQLEENIQSVEARHLFGEYAQRHPAFRAQFVREFPNLDARYPVAATVAKLRPDQVVAPDAVINVQEMVSWRNHRFELPSTAVIRGVGGAEGRADGQDGFELKKKLEAPLPPDRGRIRGDIYEDKNRLGLQGERAEVRGLSRELLTYGFDAKAYWRGVERGRDVRLVILAEGARGLSERGIALNPFPALHESLQAFLRNQPQAAPRTRGLRPHEIEMRVRQALEGWPDDPTNEEDRAFRDWYEGSVRRKLSLEEVESSDLALKRGAPREPAPAAFAAWRKRALEKVEADYKRNLRHVIQQLGPHGVLLVDESTRAPITSEALARLRLDGGGEWLDADGNVVKISSMRPEVEKALLAGPTRLDARELGERAALADAYETMRGNYRLAARSLSRESTRAELLAHYYDWTKGRREHDWRRDGADHFNDFLWSRLEGGRSNHWRDRQADAIARNRPVMPILKRFEKVAFGMLGATILTGGVAVNQGWLGPGSLGPTAGDSTQGGARKGPAQSAQVGEAALDNPGKPPKDPVFKLKHEGPETPSIYSVAQPSELATAEVEILKLPKYAPKPAAGNSSVTVTSVHGQVVRRGRPILIPRPDGMELKGLRLIYPDGYPMHSSEYDIIRDPRTHDLAVRVTDDYATRFILTADFETAAPGSYEAREQRNRGEGRSFDPILEGPRLERIVDQLKEAGFESLPKALEAHLAAHQGKLPASELRRILQSNTVYSYRPTTLPKRATRAEWERNPFFAYSAALNEDGNFAAVCAGHNLLEKEILNRALGPDSPYRAEVRSAWANGNGDGFLTADEAHAQNFVFHGDRGSVPIVLDATSPNQDGFSGPREDRLPSHGSTPGQRRRDQGRQVAVGWVALKRQDEELDAFFMGLGKKVEHEKTRPLTAREHIMETWLAEVNAAEKAGAPPPPEPFDAEKSLREAEPVYLFEAEIQRSKRLVFDHGAELRRKGRAKAVGAGDPVARVTELANRVSRLLADAPERAEWESRSRALSDEAKQALQRLRDQRALREIAQAHQLAKLRGEPLRLTDEQSGILRRTRVDPRQAARAVPLGLEDDRMAELLENQLEGLVSRLESLGAASIEALNQVRRYQPEAHRERIEAGAPGGCLRRMADELGA